MPTGKYQHENFNGKGNPFYGKKHTKETKEKLRLIHLGKKVSQETKEKQRLATIKQWEEGKRKYQPQTGFQGKEKHWNWMGGISRQPYSTDWKESLRRSIRERDKYICQLCYKTQGDNAHDVHHIDYNKQNCDPTNLITLCHLCNTKVNKNRNYWTNHFQKINTESIKQ